MSSKTEAHLFLSKHVVQELVHPISKLVIVKEDQSVAVVLELLWKNNISSAPVVSKNNEWIGMIDTLDLVAFCDTKLGRIPDMVWDVFRQMDEFTTCEVKNLLNLSGRNQWIPVSNDKTILDLMHFFTLKDIHRFPIVDQKGNCIGIVTQTDVVEYLWKNKELFPEKMKQKVGEWKKDSKVSTILMNDLVIDAFQKMWKDEVSGLAVVSGNNILVGNISAKDLTHIDLSELFQELYQPIMKYRKIFHRHCRG